MNTETLPQTMNGNAPDGEVSEFPVSTFGDAARHLRRPFTANAVKFKVQSAYPKDNPTGALIVAYIDARLVAERLNLVCPQLWFDEYDQHPDGMVCRLTIDGITRQDFGDGYKGKGLYSDAFKRAAVKFGIGVSLYAVPSMRLSKEAGDLRDTKTRSGPSLALTTKGEDVCRARYSKWLGEVGEHSFGKPLDHGDAEDAVGDVEADFEDTEVEIEGMVPPAIAKQIVDRAWKVPEAKQNFQLAVSHKLGEDVGATTTKAAAVKAVQRLSFGQAEGLSSWVARKEGGSDE